ncbi:DNA cytosine methyltransferase [Comamonas testosteroni]|uniref:DNA cytosine methyltransferase n=1 Tax=Comamonas testosteroni TaxID=285 RepID=UPI00265E4C3C|nr:DNA cytosine methyltransferase [Comamonas testosteroni]WKL16586.1 DNA cytosine methyltransferase [Comamonas testosteroni]
MLTPQFVLALAAKLVIDLFAGGGGASTGIEQAIGRPVDDAINHDADAIGMHTVNHPQTRHHRADIREVCPRTVTGGRPVGLLHASPDCTHHSQALGGQPRSTEIRSLAWIVVRWAGVTKPDVITLENVEQMLQWSRLIAKRDPATGRVITLDKIKDAKGKTTYRVADPGERVPRHNQFLVPDKKQLGKTWNRFVQSLRDLGYKVEWRVICNADLGCHSTRTRLYMIARRDGLPIVWPEKTHAKKPVGALKPHAPAADCIDWSIPGTSIFGRKKDLAEATMRRIAHGMQKYVIGSKDPFIAPAAANAAFITKFNTGSVGVDLREPVPTVTAGGNPVRPGTGTTIGLIAASLVQMGYGEREGQEPRALDLRQALGTVVAGGNKFATASAYLVQAGHGEGTGATKRRSHGTNDIRGPIGTITASGGGQSLATAFMVQANGGFNTTPARDLREGMSTVTTSGSQQQLITAKLEQQSLSPEHEAGALRCAAFLMRYHGSGGQWADLRDPMTTVTTHDRLALVTVWLKGEPWVIVDITLRMLVPRELYNAQDFPPDYIIDRTAAGKPLTKTAQVKMAGNSVSPLPMRKIVSLNYSEAGQLRKVA